MDQINNQDLLLKYDKWVFYMNVKNYREMPNAVRNTFQKMLCNRNTIPFDTKNKIHLRYDDWLRERIEMEVYDRKINENDTYLFAKHLQFIDTDNQRQLHNKIRNEIFNIRLNYTEENETDTDTDYED